MPTNIARVSISGLGTAWPCHQGQSLPAPFGAFDSTLCHTR